MKTKKEIPDSARKILRTLLKAPFGFLNKEIKNLTGLSEPVIAYDLVLLQQKKYIERSIDHRYKIIENGKRFMGEIDAVARIEESGIHFENVVEILFGYEPKFTSLPTMKSWVNSLSKQKIEIQSYLAFDNKYKDSTESIIKQLQKSRVLDWIPMFFSQLGNVVAEKHFDPKSLEKSKRIKDFVSFVIDENRAKMDYTATLLISFNGAEVAEKIDWEAQMKNDAEKWEQEETKERQLLKKAQEDDDLRRAWIEELVISNLSCGSFGDLNSSTPAELKANLAKHIKKHINDKLMMLEAEIPAGISNISDTEIQQVLENLIGSGAVITKPRYVFEIDEEKLQARKQKNIELFEAVRKKIEKEQ